MSTVILTKQAMAKAFKDLMTKHPINKITVKMITDNSGVTRHTFYNHFHDVYELLGWIYENELIEELDQNCNLSNWRKGLSLVLEYTYENQAICSNTCKSLGREHLERFLHKTFQSVVEGVIDDISSKYECDDVHKKNIASFFSFAISGEFIQWIINGFAEDKENLENRIVYLLNGTISHLMMIDSMNK